MGRSYVRIATDGKAHPRSLRCAAWRPPSTRDAAAKTGVRVAPVTEVWSQIAPFPEKELARRVATGSSPASPAR